MKPVIAAAFGATIVLFASAQTGLTGDSETAGFRILEVSCAVDSEDGESLRCVAEIQRTRDDVGLLTAAWGLDGGFLATDAVTGSVTSWVLDDPPSGEHVVNIVVVDSETELAADAVTDIDIESMGASLTLWLSLAAVSSFVGILGILLWHRRRGGGTESPKCPACLATVAESDGFCPACGSDLSLRGDLLCPGCGSPAGADDRFCPSCGVAYRGESLSGR